MFLKHDYNHHPPHEEQSHEYQSHEQLINTRYPVGYPVQALNVANNMHIPPSTKQIINIQPPSISTHHPSVIEVKRNQSFTMILITILTSD